MGRVQESQQKQKIAASRTRIDVQVVPFCIFIGPKYDHCLVLSVTLSFTQSVTPIFETWLMWPWHLKMRELPLMTSWEVVVFLLPEQNKGLADANIKIFKYSTISNIDHCPPGASCNENTECYDKEVKRTFKKYDGCVNTTVSGKSCQVWNDYLGKFYTFLQGLGLHYPSQSHVSESGRKLLSSGRSHWALVKTV